MKKCYDALTSAFGVLKFLYSVILSKGVENILNETDNPESSLIDSLHGHGSQNLINLFLCGQAVSNVFDGDKDIAGLSLRGISQTCPVGFLTLLERLRYCTVGDNLKRPENPVWLVGSETHLSRVFSLNTSLVAPIQAREKAQKVFDRFDPEDSGFISCALLENLLNEVDLVSETEYVKLMTQTLDPEELGVILRSKFMDEFFPDDAGSSIPDSFEIFHYNGLEQSSQDGQVRFRRGVARIIDWQDTQHKSSDSLIESCLQMKWPGLWITWDDGQPPSLN
jgi:hypothetical protein